MNFINIINTSCFKSLLFRSLNKLKINRKFFYFRIPLWYSKKVLWSRIQPLPTRLQVPKRNAESRSKLAINSLSGRAVALYCYFSEVRSKTVRIGWVKLLKILRALLTSHVKKADSNLETDSINNDNSFYHIATKISAMWLAARTSIFTVSVQRAQYDNIALQWKYEKKLKMADLQSPPENQLKRHAPVWVTATLLIKWKVNLGNFRVGSETGTPWIDIKILEQIFNYISN